MSKKNNSLAVIITLYNSNNYIKLLLESIANQTVPFDEVILIDHGSKDNCYELALKYASDINLVLKSNQLKLNKGGPAWPRNMGIRMCQSKYICFNDADDIPLLNRCEEIKNQLINSQPDILIHPYQQFLEKKGHENLIKFGRKIDNKFTSKNIYKKLYFGELSTPVGSYIIRRIKFNQTLFREDKDVIGGEDRVILLDLLRNNCSIIHFNKILFLYNSGKLENNKILRSSLTNRNNSIKISKYIINNFRNDFEGSISSRYLISIYYSYIVLKKYKLLIQDLYKYGLKNNLKAFLLFIKIIFKRFLNIYIYNYKNNKIYLLKNLFTGYKIF